MLREQVIHSMKWVAFGKAITQIIRWSTTFMVIRLLVPSDYGVIAIADFFISFLWLFSIAGAGTAVIKSHDLTKESLGGFFMVILIFNFFLFLLLWGSSEYIGGYYNNLDVTDVIAVSAFCFLIIAFHIIPSALIAKEMDFKKLAYIEIVSQLSGAFSTLYMAYLGMGFWALVYGQILRLLIMTLLSNIYSPMHVWPNLHFRKAKKMVLFGGTVSVESVVFHVYTQMDVAIAGLILATSEIGAYSVAMLVAAIPLSKIMPSVKQVAMPAYTKVNKDIKVVAKYCLKSQRIAMFLMVPIFFGLSSVANTLVTVIFENRWEGAIVPLTLLCLIMPLRASEELFSPALKATGKTGVLLTNTTIIFLIMLASILIGVRYGIDGLAMAWVCGFPVAFFLIVNRITRTLGISFADYVRAIRVPFIIGLVMYGSVELVEIIMDGFSPLVVLIMSIIVGAMVYVSVSWAFNRSVFQEVIQLRN